MTMITPSYLGETIEYSSLHACRSTLEDPTVSACTSVPVNPAFCRPNSTLAMIRAEHPQNSVTNASSVSRSSGNGWARHQT